MEFLQHLLQYAITPSRKSKPKVQEFVHRDELSKKQAPVKVKKKVRFETEALIQRDETKKNQERMSEKDDFSRDVAVNREKHRIKVKILMTKEEAARLLSKCKDGGILEFEDVTDELVQIPKYNRVNVVSSNRND